MREEKINTKIKRTQRKIDRQDSRGFLFLQSKEIADTLIRQAITSQLDPQYMQQNIPWLEYQWMSL